MPVTRPDLQIEYPTPPASPSARTKVRQRDDWMVSQAHTDCQAAECSSTVRKLSPKQVTRRRDFVTSGCLPTPVRLEVLSRRGPEDASGWLAKEWKGAQLRKSQHRVRRARDASPTPHPHA
jgi:hypothetical protein